MNSWFIVVLIAASAIGTGLMIMAMKKGRAKQADYQKIAEDLGWTYVHDTTSAAYGIAETFSDPEDDWTLKIIFVSGGPSGGSSSRRIEWHSPSGALSEGEAALGMPMPEKTVMMMTGGGKMAEQITKAAIKATMYALGRTKFSLALDEATAADPGGVVLSTAGQEKAMDKLRLSKELAAFRQGRKEADVPVIIRNEDGLTLRRANVTSDGGELSALVALGKSLRADLEES